MEDGAFLGKLILSDEVNVGTTKEIDMARSNRRMPADQQWNPQILRIFVGLPWNPHDLITDSFQRIRKRYITRSPVQEHGATDGCAACHGDSQVHVPRCRQRFDDIFVREKQLGQPRAVVQQEELGRVAGEAIPVDQFAQVKLEPQRQQRATIHEPFCNPTKAIQFEPRRSDASQHDVSPCNNRRR